MRFIVMATLISVVAVASAAHAAEATLRIKDHKFIPQELVLPANEKITLTVINEDPTPAEFESEELRREKVIKGNSSAVVKLGPMKPGTYNFMEEFHEATTTGKLIVK